MSDKLWVIGYNEFKGGKAYFRADTAKEAIDKFESQYRLQWIDKPYSVVYIQLIGTVT